MSFKKIAITISILIVISIVLLIQPSANVPLNAAQLAFTNNENGINQQGSAQYKMYPFSSSSINVITKYFGKEMVEKTLKQPDCVGVRMYYVKHNKSHTFMLVGVDQNGKETTGIFGPTVPCPPLCGDK